jgi:hypothetical protein
MPTEGERSALPPMVSFTTGAELLVQLGLVPNMTREGLRKIAKTDPKWPFRPEDYVKIGNAQTMPTKPLVEFFEQRTTRGRGPAKRTTEDGDARNE